MFQHSTDELRNAIIQLDQSSQTNSATSEETAAFSEELSAQARSLQELISYFYYSKSTKKVTKTAIAVYNT